MDTPVLVAVISAAASLAVAAISFFLTKRKERKAGQRVLPKSDLSPNKFLAAL